MLDSKNLTSFEITNAPMLTKLYLYNTQINSKNFASTFYPALTFLSLKGNLNIRRYKNQFPQLLKLEIFDESNVQLSGIEAPLL